MGTGAQGETQKEDSFAMCAEMLLTHGSNKGHLIFGSGSQDRGYPGGAITRRAIRVPGMPVISFLIRMLVMGSPS